MARSGVYGDRSVVAALNELAKGISGAEIDQGAVKALGPMLADTKTRIQANRNYPGKYPGFPQPKSPRKGGHVDQGIIIRKEGASNGTRSYKLGATRRARYLLHLLEFGTAPHFQPHFKGGFMHPGARPKPALTPSFEEHRDEVPAALGRFIWERLALRAQALGRRRL